MASFRERVRELLPLAWAGVGRWRRGSLLDFYTQERAAQLLTQSLSTIQLDQLNRHGYFEVIGGDTGGKYRIRLGHQMNVERLDKYGKVVCLMCFLPEGRLTGGILRVGLSLSQGGATDRDPPRRIATTLLT